MRRRDQSGRVSAGFSVVTGRMYFYHLFKGKDLQDLYGVRVCVCPCVSVCVLVWGLVTAAIHAFCAVLSVDLTSLSPSPFSPIFQ